MNKLVSLSTISFVLIAVTLIACKKRHSCYDHELYLKNKSTFCTEDCPGVVGCDGKTYCNECKANSVGIRVK